MASVEFDPKELAEAELTVNTIPDPEQLLSDLSPFAQVYYVEQVAYFTMEQLARKLLADPDGEVTGDDGPALALQAMMTACGNLDAACVALGILPEDATAGGAV